MTGQTLLALLVNPPSASHADDMIADQDVDDLGFGVGFTQLNTCKKPLKDPYPEVTDVKVWVGEYLKQANVRHNGRIVQYVQERLEAGSGAQNAFAEILQ